MFLKVVLTSLLLSFVLSGCGDFAGGRVPPVNHGEEFKGRPCWAYFSTGIGEQIIELTGLPGIEIGKKSYVTVNSKVIGTQLFCMDFNFTKLKRLSEPEFREPDPRKPMFCMDVELWSGLAAHMKVWFRETFPAVAQMFGVT